MIFLYALVAISVVNIGNVHTIRYYDTHGECLKEKYRLEDNNNTNYIYDCWVRKANNG